MEVTCPHCQKVNKVAGYYERPCRDGQRTEGSQDNSILCGFCSGRFTPRPPEPWKEAEPC